MSTTAATIVDADWLDSTMMTLREILTAPLLPINAADVAAILSAWALIHPKAAAAPSPSPSPVAPLIIRRALHRRLTSPRAWTMRRLRRAHR